MITYCQHAVRSKFRQFFQERTYRLLVEGLDGLHLALEIPLMTGLVRSRKMHAHQVLCLKLPERALGLPNVVRVTIPRRSRNGDGIEPAVETDATGKIERRNHRCRETIPFRQFRDFW